MIRIYIIVMVCVMCVGAYFAGRNVGRATAIGACNAHATRQLIQSTKQMEKINEQTIHTAVRDIRRVLREKYTIAE